MKIINNKKLKIIILLIIVLLFCCGFGYYQYSLNKSNKEYEIKLKKVDVLISKEVNNSKTMIEKYLEQWEFANNGGEILNMDKGGIYIKGAEAIINNQMEIFDYQGKIKSLYNNRFNIKKELTNLNNPPKKFKEQFDIISQYYLNYNQYVELALSPKGSIDDYKEKTETTYKLIQNNMEELLIKL
jgi:hypothetical protein